MDRSFQLAKSWYKDYRKTHYNMENIEMITAEFTHGEVQFLIQSLEAERDQYLKDFGSNKFSFVREIAERAVEQNNMLIQKLEPLLEETVPF